jgi:predicted transcriptional regulator
MRAAKGTVHSNNHHQRQPPIQPIIIELPDLAEIRILRTRLGWTQRKLAQATGLSQSFINKIERNEADPGYKTVRAIFRVLTEALLAKSKSNGSSMTARDIMTPHMEFVSSNQTLEEARKLMIKNDFSQLPVIDNGINKGSITDKLLISLDGESDRHRKIIDLMDKRFPVVDPDTKLETLRYLLDEYSAVLIDKGGNNIGDKYKEKEYGIITKHDLIKSIK